MTAPPSEGNERSREGPLMTGRLERARSVSPRGGPPPRGPVQPYRHWRSQPPALSAVGLQCCRGPARSSFVGRSDVGRARARVPELEGVSETVREEGGVE